MKQFWPQSCCAILAQFASCSMAARAHGGLLAFQDTPFKCSHQVTAAPTLRQPTPFVPSLQSPPHLPMNFTLTQHTLGIRNTGIFLRAIYPLILTFLFLSYYFTFSCPYAFRPYYFGFLLPSLTIPFSAFLSTTFSSWKCLNTDLGLFLNKRDCFTKKRRIKMH